MRETFLLAALLVTGGPVCYGQSDAAQREWDRAAKLDSSGKHTQVMKILDGLVENPAWAYRAHMMRAHQYFEHLERYQDAFSEIGLAMSLEPDSIDPYINRSSFYLESGMPDRALEDLDQALKHAREAQDSLTVFLNKGSALTMVRRFKEALFAYDHALAIDSMDWGTRSNKAAILDEMDRADEAKAIYLKLHEEKPDEIVILNNLGFQASGRNDHAEALRWFSEAQRLAPDDPVVLNNLGYAQLRTGALNDAQRNVERSIKLYPANSYAHRNLGLIWKEKKEMDKACSSFERALQLGFTAQYGPEVEQWRKEYCR
ncbi:MAG: tetratricopeptide repeat protein [Flavobacteriales bacterium]|nr:tetratricopeptide repeat protein [Flavobacteriales bacterium]MCC6939945.1 tetratricopeptide repeat protein [Flavobacteriales bacterium]